MGRRNVVRVNLRDGAAVRQKDSNVAEPAEKRQKITHDFFPSKPSTPLLSDKDKTESSAAGGSRMVEKSLGSAGPVGVPEFAPSYALAEGRVVNVEDSVKMEPGLAVAVLQGLALPRDMQKVPDDLQPSLVHASAYLVQAGQALLRASNKAELVSAERSRYREDLKTERDKVKTLKSNLKVAKAHAAELEAEKVELEERAKKAERELGKVLRREKRKMKEVDGKAYQAGFDRAGAEYVREARSMVNDEVKSRVPIAYRTGYKDGVKAACAVMQLEPDLNLTKSIPAPVTPELVLPYTEEECAPLPPEDFPDSDDDVEEVSGDEGETRATPQTAVGAGGQVDDGSKKTVDGDGADGEQQNVEGNAEAGTGADFVEAAGDAA
ncbi:uncharacterized protein LOC131327138 [Rhododendron vialii]|uniref:uncharacterized protein LOC131327138 n=1 Tax=Rhododendron vialii TaxID=182163 RepID=UPI00265E4AB3|nr:uncharacterized protein LOC131327138 [Rhododendron vialii]